MTLIWMIYSVLIAASFALAAAALEWILRAFRRPARGTWACAVVASVVLSLAALIPEAHVATSAGATSGDAQSIAPVQQQVAAAIKWTAALGSDTFFQAVWAATTLVLATIIAAAVLRLGRERRRWRSEDIDGHPVLVSPSTGPGVVGVTHATIVVPEWVLALKQGLQRLIVRHEEEHLRARDLWLILAAVMAIVLLPWNLALWFQLRRLRLAIEIDCDRRVLGRGTPVRSYAELLLTSAKYQRTRLQPVGMALTESRTSLERRIDDMTRQRVPFRRTRSFMHALVAFGLVAVACDTPIPDAPDLSQQDAELQPPVRTLALVREDSTKVYLKLNMADESENPLYVVDGVIIADGEIDVDKMNIEVIEVAKGAAASELYGPRAVHGVVSITTKNGASPEEGQLVPLKAVFEEGN